MVLREVGGLVTPASLSLILITGTYLPFTQLIVAYIAALQHMAFRPTNPRFNRIITTTPLAPKANTTNNTRARRTRCSQPSKILPIGAGSVVTNMVVQIADYLLLGRKPPTRQHRRSEVAVQLSLPTSRGLLARAREVAVHLLRLHAVPFHSQPFKQRLGRRHPPLMQMITHSDHLKNYEWKTRVPKRRKRKTSTTRRRRLYQVSRP